MSKVEKGTVIVVSTPELVARMMSWLFFYYKSLDEVSKAFPDGFTLLGPSDNDPDHDKHMGDQRCFLVVRGSAHK